MQYMEPSVFAEGYITSEGTTSGPIYCISTAISFDAFLLVRHFVFYAHARYFQQSTCLQFSTGSWVAMVQARVLVSPESRPIAFEDGLLSCFLWSTE